MSTHTQESQGMGLNIGFFKNDTLQVLIVCLIIYTIKIHGLLVWKHVPTNVTARKLLFKYET